MLTPRETEILQLCLHGLTNPEITEILKVKKSTVRTHLEHIYLKLDVNNRTEAVVEGIRRGLVEL